MTRVRGVPSLWLVAFVMVGSIGGLASISVGVGGFSVVPLRGLAILSEPGNHSETIEMRGNDLHQGSPHPLIFRKLIILPMGNSLQHIYQKMEQFWNFLSIFLHYSTGKCRGFLKKAGGRSSNGRPNSDSSWVAPGKCRQIWRRAMLGMTIINNKKRKNHGILKATRLWLEKGK